MLFKVIVFAIASSGLRAPTRLEPQFEADDEAGAKEKLGSWLESTGYQLNPEFGEPQFIPLTDEGSEQPVVPKESEETPVDTSASKEPEDQLVIGETKNAEGATYMGHDAHGNAVWDPPAPDSDGSSPPSQS